MVDIPFGGPDTTRVPPDLLQRGLSPGPEDGPPPVAAAERVEQKGQEQSGTEVERREGEPQTREDADRVSEDLNHLVATVNQGLSFRVRESDDQLVVQIVDRETDEVIREVPPERAIEIRDRISEAIGLIIDEHV